MNGPLCPCLKTMLIRLPPIIVRETDGRWTLKLDRDPENRSLLDGIENETVVTVVDPEGTIPSDCRYSLVELKAVDRPSAGVANFSIASKRDGTSIESVVGRYGAP